MRLLNGCLMLVASGLAILLIVVGVFAFLGAMFASFEGPGGSLVGISAVVHGASWLASGILIISLRGRYLRVKEAPWGWAAIFGGVVLLLVAPIVGGLLVAGQTEGSAEWEVGLAVRVLVQCLVFLLVVRGVRAVAGGGSESLGLPRGLANRVVSGPLLSANDVSTTADAMRGAVRWLVTSDPGPRSPKVLIAAMAEILSGIVIILWLSRLLGLNEFGVAWGILMVLSGIGLYAQIGLAWISSVGLSAPAAVLGMLVLALVEGESALEYAAFGLVIASGGLVLYAAGWLGRVLGWLTSSTS